MDHTYSDIFLSLGSNQGDRAGMLKQACELVEQRIGPILQRSSLYETEPWKMKEAHSFLNQVIRVTSSLRPLEMLRILKEIERELGRYQMPDARSRIKNQVIRHPASGIYLSRCIDLDILFFGNETVSAPTLVIPHHLIAERKFILVPMAEIAPEFHHPELHRTISDLLTNCSDTRTVKFYLSP